MMAIEKKDSKTKPINKACKTIDATTNINHLHDLEGYASTWQISQGWPFLQHANHGNDWKHKYMHKRQTVISLVLLLTQIQ